jgi:hypothetical protein
MDEGESLHTHDLNVLHSTSVCDDLTIKSFVLHLGRWGSGYRILDCSEANLFSKEFF